MKLKTIGRMIKSREFSTIGIPEQLLRADKFYSLPRKFHKIGKSEPVEPFFSQVYQYYCKYLQETFIIQCQDHLN